MEKNMDKYEFFINADDFGWSESCTKAILTSFEHGWIQTTTMIVPGAYFKEAAEQVKSSGLKDALGIHFDLTEGTPLTDGIKGDPFFCGENGDFHMRPQRYKPLSRETKQRVYDELRAQAQRFFDAGLSCHHADSHHHIHTAPFVFPIVADVAKEFGIQKIRITRDIGAISFPKNVLKKAFNFRLRSLGVDYTDHFGSFEDAATLPRSGEATVEIMCHPDYDEQGVIVDRSGLAPYDAPFGEELKILVETLHG